MRKSISVFSHAANPAIDQPDFFITRHEAEDRVNKSYAHYISATAIQHQPPVTFTRDESQLIVSSLFREAWAPKPSADYIVWQMRSTNGRFG